MSYFRKYYTDRENKVAIPPTTAEGHCVYEFIMRTIVVVTDSILKLFEYKATEEDLRSCTAEQIAAMAMPGSSLSFMNK